MRARRRVVTIGLPIESLIESYAVKRGVSFSTALVMIISEWQMGAKLLPDGYPVVDMPILPGEKTVMQVDMEAAINEAMRRKAKEI